MEDKWNKELLLNDEYSLDVRVEYFDTKEFMGKLDISKNKINLEVYGHIDNSISIPDRFSIVKLQCTYKLSKEIYLYGLERIRSTIDFLGNNQTAFVEKYNVKELLYCDGHFLNDISSYAFEIISEDLVKWIGDTEKQYELIHNYTNDMEFNEVFLNLNNCYLIVDYTRTNYGNTLSEGIFLTPRIKVLMKDNHTFSEIKNIYIMSCYIYFIYYWDTI